MIPISISYLTMLSAAGSDIWLLVTDQIILRVCNNARDLSSVQMH